MTFKNTLPYIALISAITISLIALIWMDYETTSWSHVFPYGILFIWLIYGLPLLILITISYHVLKRKMDNWSSMIFSIMFGIPFFTVILILIYRFILI